MTLGFTMKNEDKISNEQLDEYLTHQRGLQRDYLAEIIKSRKIAWRVAAVAVVFGALGFGSWTVLLPLKETVPFLLKLDPSSGAIESLSVLEAETKSYDDVVDDHFLSQYVLSRETYNFYTVQSDYDKTLLMSEGAAASEYDALFAGDNALDKKYQNSVELKPTVTSVTISPSKEESNRVATVRYSVKVIKNNLEPKTINYVATISYHYVNGVMKASQRRINPLGFKAITYQSVQEVNQ